MDLFLVIVVSGGAKVAESLSSVEVLHANGSFLCELPSLPSPREASTQEGLVLCGGRDRNADISSQEQTKTSCLTFCSCGKSWQNSHTLMHQPDVSWVSPSGLVMFGREGTTEILTDDGNSTKHFDLDYQIKG